MRGCSLAWARERTSSLSSPWALSIPVWGHPEPYSRVVAMSPESFHPLLPAFTIWWHYTSTSATCLETRERTALRWTYRRCLMVFTPRVCQVQPFVGWHCAGSDVDGVGSGPPHRWWIEQCCPLNLWKCGAEVWGGAGVCIEVAEAQAPFPFPQCVLDPEELAGVMLFAALSVSEALQLWTHHSQRGRAPRRAETMPVPGWSHRLCFIL